VFSAEHRIYSGSGAQGCPQQGCFERYCYTDRDVIRYRIGNDLELEPVIELYRASTLGERRPVDDRTRMQAMLDHANLVVTAWDGDLLVGISRSLSDFAYATYLSDLAVRLSHQRKGIGRELIRITQRKGGDATIILLAAPKAVNYYPRLGFTRHDSAWILRSEGVIT
jgi:GNAT superfamily N-acetyltransferase